jgi:ABC-type transport system involved in multi-copper enzyme maturation permease subunit
LFTRDALTSPRRPRFFVLRAGYAASFFVLLWTTWQAVIGFDRDPTLGETARLNRIAFELFSYTQLAVVLFGGALIGASSIAIEKDRRTFILLLVTRLSDAEIVLGKFASALLQIGSVFLASVPVYFLLSLFGGVSYSQVGQVLVTIAGAGVVSVGLGCLMAVWRDKTFQAVALTILGITLSLLAVEVLVTLFGAKTWRGESVESWLAAVSPIRSIAAAMLYDPSQIHAIVPGPLYAILGIVTAMIYLAMAIVGLRVWNPRGETIEPRESEASSTGASLARTRTATRAVWSNPVLWREIQTRAYGARPVLIKLAYLVIVGILLARLFSIDPAARNQSPLFMLAQSMVPVMVISLILINAQALASVTSERDLKSIDLLLVTDVTAVEFIVGKLMGVAYNAKEMFAGPIVMLVLSMIMGWSPIPQTVFTVIVFLVLAVFVSVLGLHSGLRHETSRAGIVHSLGTVFLLFVGIFVCLYLIVISGRFEAQWASFVLFIILGSMGLWISLSANAPSSAITLTASLAPVATFYCILAIVVGDRFAPFAVATSVYSFAIASLLVPMLAEFDVATGRTNAEGD